MKEVKAIIQPFLVSNVVQALKEIEGLPGLTVDKDVKGFGRSRAKGSPNSVMDELVEYVPKVKLEMVVADELVDTVVATILKHAHTGNAGDGKIFIINVEDVIGIRTGKRDLCSGRQV